MGIDLCNMHEKNPQKTKIAVIMEKQPFFVKMIIIIFCILIIIQLYAVNLYIPCICVLKLLRFADAHSDKICCMIICSMFIW